MWQLRGGSTPTTTPTTTPVDDTPTLSPDDPGFFSATGPCTCHGDASARAKVHEISGLEGLRLSQASITKTTYRNNGKSVFKVKVPLPKTTKPIAVTASAGVKVEACNKPMFQPQGAATIGIELGAELEVTIEVSSTRTCVCVCVQRSTAPRSVTSIHTATR